MWITKDTARSPEMQGFPQQPRRTVLLGQLQLFLSLGPKAGEHFFQSTGPNRVSLKTLLGSPTVQGLWTMVSADFKVAVLRFEVYGT